MQFVSRLGLYIGRHILIRGRKWKLTIRSSRGKEFRGDGDRPRDSVGPSLRIPGNGHLHGRYGDVTLLVRPGRFDNGGKGVVGNHLCNPFVSATKIKQRRLNDKTGWNLAQFVRTREQSLLDIPPRLQPRRQFSRRGHANVIQIPKAWVELRSDGRNDVVPTVQLVGLRNDLAGAAIEHNPRRAGEQNSRFPKVGPLHRHLPAEFHLDPSTVAIATSTGQRSATDDCQIQSLVERQSIRQLIQGCLRPPGTGKGRRPVHVRCVHGHGLVLVIQRPIDRRLQPPRHVGGLPIDEARGILEAAVDRPSSIELEGIALLPGQLGGPILGDGIEQLLLDLVAAEEFGAEHLFGGNLVVGVAFDGRDRRGM